MTPLPYVMPPRSPGARTLLVTSLGLLLTGCGGSDSEAKAADAPDLFTVKRQEMRIVIREQAELRAAQETRVRSEVEGQATIIYLIPEGSVVEEGDKLVELDISDLEERRANQAIDVERAKAALVNAQQNVEILEKELAAEEGEAQSQLEIAKIDLEKFLGRLRSENEIEARQQRIAEIEQAAETGEGDGDLSQVQSANTQVCAKLDELTADEARYSDLGNTLRKMILGPDRNEANLYRDIGELGQQVLEQVDQIFLAKQQLALAKDAYEASVRLNKKNYVTRNKLEQDRLSFESNKSKVELAWQQLDVLVSYTLRRTQIDLQLKLDNAVIGVERVTASAKARRAREQAELSSKQSEYDLAAERLENLEKQINNGIIYAPTPGLVVYSALDGRGREYVEEGKSVRERQTMLILPNVLRMQAELKIQESDVEKLEVGQPATVAVEAFPDRAFGAVISRVSPLADSGSRWSNDNRKVYKTWVDLTANNTSGDLKPNMASWVEILVEEIPETLPVPISAVRREGILKYVWKQTPDGPEAVAVEIGRNSLTEVEITSGVSEGDVIYLAPPDGAIVPQALTIEAERRKAEADAARAKEEAEQARLAAERAKNDPLQQPDFLTKLKTVSMDSFKKEFLAKHPDMKDAVENDRAFFFRGEGRDLVQADPELKALSDALMEKMRSQFGGRGGRPGGGRPRGGRNN